MGVTLASNWCASTCLAWCSKKGMFNPMVNSQPKKHQQKVLSFLFLHWMMMKPWISRLYWFNWLHCRMPRVYCLGASGIQEGEQWLPYMAGIPKEISGRTVESFVSTKCSVSSKCWPGGKGTGSSFCGRIVRNSFGHI